MIYFYALVQPPTLALKLPTGIQQPVTIVSTDQLAAVVEFGLDLLTLQQENRQLMQAVLTHDRVILDLFQQTPVLPLRFGTEIDSVDRLMSHLVAQQVAYCKRLRQLGRKAEYKLTLTPVASPAIAPAAALRGKAYLLAKKQQFQVQEARQAQQQREREELYDWLTQLYFVYRGEASDGTEAWHLLSERSLESLLHYQIRTRQETLTSWQLTLSTALPPYHFLD